MECLRVSGNELLLDIKAVPGASKSRIAGISAGRLRVTIAAAPEDGKANEELRSFLAKSFGIPKKEITLKAGEKSRLKTLSFSAKFQSSVEERLKDLLKIIIEGKT
jgi:uncharacterized protein (TIGR00251 family)